MRPRQRAVPAGVKRSGWRASTSASAAAVAALLAQVRAQPGAAVVPHERGRVEADLPLAVEHLPAQVDVVAGRRVDRVEAADLVEHAPPERHVAAGDVLGPVVGDQHVHRAARRRGDLLGAEPGRRAAAGSARRRRRPSGCRRPSAR